MFNVFVESKFKDTNEKDVQEKYFYNNQYYKLDKNGAEGITEELASLILFCSNLENKEYVNYEYGKINGANGCRSQNFLNGEERFFDFNRLHIFKVGERLDWHLRRANMAEKIEYTIDFIKKATNLDVTNYIRKCITLDRIIKNPDRHFSNLGVVLCEDETFKTAPIFDNGAALMSNMSIMYIKSLDDNLSEIKANPFSDDIEEMYNYFGPGFQVNFKQLIELLNKNYNINKGEYGYEQILILKHQANKYLNSELNLENALDEKISNFQKPEYRIENGILILNESAQKECDELINEGIIIDRRQYPAFLDSNR